MKLVNIDVINSTRTHQPQQLSTTTILDCPRLLFLCNIKSTNNIFSSLLFSSLLDHDHYFFQQHDILLSGLSSPESIVTLTYHRSDIKWNAFFNWNLLPQVITYNKYVFHTLLFLSRINLGYFES